MNNYLSKQKQGFAIVEMIIYIAVLVLLLGVIVSITFSMIQSHRAIKASRNIENGAISSLERITRELRQADSVNLTSSVFDDDQGVLALDSTDENNNSYSVEFSLNSGAVVITKDSVVVGSLTQGDTTVNALNFSLFSAPQSTGVRITLTLESGEGEAHKSRTFYTSAILR